MLLNHKVGETHQVAPLEQPDSYGTARRLFSAFLSFVAQNLLGPPALGH